MRGCPVGYVHQGNVGAAPSFATLRYHVLPLVANCCCLLLTDACWYLLLFTAAACCYLLVLLTATLCCCCLVVMLAAAAGSCWLLLALMQLALLLPALLPLEGLRTRLGHLEASWAVLGLVGAILGSLRPTMSVASRPLGLSGGSLGAIWGGLGAPHIPPSWALLGCLGAQWGP